MTQESFVVDLYIRVSTDRQAKEGDSLEEQESELKKFCEYRNFKIHKVFIERGKSGGNTNRPEYKKLVKDIENGKINAVVVKKLDRLSRSLLDFEQLMTNHQPLVSEETFEKVHAIFNDRELKSPRNSIKGLLKNIFICGRCHNHMRPHYTKKKNGNIYRYYRCATTINNKVKSTLCAGQYVPIETANQAVLDLIVSFSSETELQKI